MKITCVQSLAPGAQQSSTLDTKADDAFVNIDEDDDNDNMDDDSNSIGSNESGVVFVESVANPLNQGSNSGDERDTPMSPDPVGESSELQCGINKDETDSSSPTIIPSAQLVDLQSPQSPDAIEILKPPASADTIQILEPPASPDTIQILESPASPDAAVEGSKPPANSDAAVEGPESPASPDDVIEILEPPASPSPSEAQNVQSNPLKVRFELRDDSSGMVPFSLDKEGDGSVSSSNIENKTDTNSDNPSSNQAATSAVRPLYSVDATRVLDDQQVGSSKDITKKSTESQLSFPPKRTCFNCMGDHTLHKCPQPHNANLIASRRREYFYNRGGPVGKEVRYHESHAMPTSGYDNYNPGVISGNLRSVIGLANNEVPGYIYRMRQYGYPPGWFNQAVDNASSLKVYGADIVSNSRSRLDKLERLKRGLVEYPGLTCPVPPGYRDDGARLGVPFNDKYTIDNLANQWYHQRQSQNEGRDFLTAKRTSGVNKSIETGTQSYSGYKAPQFASRSTHFGSSNLVPDECQNEWEQSSISKTVRRERNWYDDLLPSTPAKPHITSDMQEIQKIYQNVIEKKTTEPGLGWTDLQYQGIHPGSGNYRETEEIERREEEARKMLADKKKAEMEFKQKQRKRESDKHRKSPSLLDDIIPMEFTTSYSSDVVNETSALDVPKEVSNEENKINQKIGKRPQKRPLESEAEVITIDSDDEDEGGGEKKVEMLPNPLFKKPRLADPIEESPVTRISVSPLKRSSTCKTVAAAGETMSWDEEERLNGKGKKLPVAFTPIPQVRLPSATQNVTQTSCFQDEEINKHDLLNILAKNSEKIDSLVFADLPPMSNFSKGMSELPLQQEATEFSGRLSKVLGIIHSKKDNQRIEEDDDVQIIE